MGSPPTAARTVRPAEGYPLILLSDQQVRVLWWGPDASGQDCLASDDGQLLSWPSLTTCANEVRRRGWTPANDPDDPTDPPAASIDLDAAVLWLRGRRLTLDPTAALNLWNLAGDVAYSTRLPWSDHGQLAGHCYDKLLAADVPWLAGRERYSPRWTPRELRWLRGHLAGALALLRAALPPDACRDPG